MQRSHIPARFTRKTGLANVLKTQAGKALGNRVPVVADKPSPRTRLCARTRNAIGLNHERKDLVFMTAVPIQGKMPLPDRTARSKASTRDNAQTIPDETRPLEARAYLAEKIPFPINPDVQIHGSPEMFPHAMHRTNPTASGTNHTMTMNENGMMTAIRAKNAYIGNSPNRTTKSAMTEGRIGTATEGTTRIAWRVSFTICRPAMTFSTITASATTFTMAAIIT